MRVTHLISNLDVGGAEGSLCTLVEARPRGDVQHTVISMLESGVHAERLRDAGAELVELPGRRSISMALQFPELGRALGASRPDVVNCWMYHANLAASLAAKLGYFHAPTIWGVRQSLARLSNEKPLTQAVVTAAVPLRRHPEAIVYNSMRSALDHEALGYPPAKRWIINNAVDTDRFQPRSGARAALVRALSVTDDALLIGRVGRKSRMKDHGTLLAAMNLIRRQFPNAHLVLVGRGMDAGDIELESVVSSHQLAGAVHFLGQRTDVELLYPAFDLLLSSSSDNEGFPNVVAEALACGVPAAVTDVGESRAIVRHDGWVVPPRNPEALAAIAGELLGMSLETRRSLGRDARQSVIERFGTERMLSEFLTLWRRALKTDRH